MTPATGKICARTCLIHYIHGLMILKERLCLYSELRSAKHDYRKSLHKFSYTFNLVISYYLIHLNTFPPKGGLVPVDIPPWTSKTGGAPSPLGTRSVYLRRQSLIIVWSRDFHTWPCSKFSSDVLFLRTTALALEWVSCLADDAARSCQNHGMPLDFSGDRDGQGG